jgi:amylosucrase
MHIVTMNLTSDQQARAAQTYVEDKIDASKDCAQVLQDRDFRTRLDVNFATLYTIFIELYGHRGDSMDEIVNLISLVARSWLDRPVDLKNLDRERERDPEWYMSNTMLGGVCYVDRYAGDLAGVWAKIPYFKELGLTYLHLMPLFDCPEPLNDGGYAVTNYRKVMPSLGTIDQLKDLATELRRNNISLVLDMVFNHTSNEHEWAKQAAAGNREYSDYYWIFPDRTVPDAFESTTREVFPCVLDFLFPCLSFMFYETICVTGQSSYSNPFASYLS